MSYLYWLLGLEECDIEACPKQKALRHILHKQIKLGGLRLKSVATKQRTWSQIVDGYGR